MVVGSFVDAAGPRIVVRVHFGGMRTIRMVVAVHDRLEPACSDSVGSGIA
jgi:hypothetical protein